MFLRVAATLSLLLPLSLLPAGPARGKEFLAPRQEEQGVPFFTNIPRHRLGQRLPALARGEGAGERFRPLIVAAAAAEGLDPRLLTAIIQEESAFNPGATSRRGAQGLMQLMPATAQGYAVRNAYDPAENIRGGARYLRHLLNRFADNLALVLAAYNAGEAAVHRSGGVPPFPETRQYVRRVQARYRALGGRHPIRSLRTPPPDPRSRIYRLHDQEGRLLYTNVPPAHPGFGPLR